jgi:hypothetical protein
MVEVVCSAKRTVLEIVNLSMEELIELIHSNPDPRERKRVLAVQMVRTYATVTGDCQPASGKGMSESPASAGSEGLNRNSTFCWSKLSAHCSLSRVVGSGR